jgi:hypothetical protein
MIVVVTTMVVAAGQIKNSVSLSETLDGNRALPV